MAVTFMSQDGNKDPSQWTAVEPFQGQYHKRLDCRLKCVYISIKGCLYDNDKLTDKSDNKYT